MGFSFASNKHILKPDQIMMYFSRAIKKLAKISEL